MNTTVLCFDANGYNPAVSVTRQISVDEASIIRVAIVDKDWVYRGALARYLNYAARCRCIGACSSMEQAVQIVLTLRPDIVLVDIELFSISGADCIRQLRKLYPPVRIICLAVFEDGDRIFGGIRAGANGYLLKRVQPDEILFTIRRIKEGGSGMNSQIARRIIKIFKKATKERPNDRKFFQRDLVILEALSMGYSCEEIALQLATSPAGISKEIDRVYQKLHAIAVLSPCDISLMPPVRGICT